MAKRFLKIFGIILGSILFIILLGNLALNFWLKSKLPDYIEKNSDYIIKYKSLDVDLETGNIFATKIFIKNKNPENNNVLKITGHADTLKISRFGIYDTLFKNKISTSKIYLSNPDLNITLSKPPFKKQEKKDFLNLNNLKIVNGNITIFKPSGQVFFSINKLQLDIKNLKISDKKEQHQLPFSFDKYNISGNNIFFQNECYTMKIKEIKSKNNVTKIIDLKIKPILNSENFSKTFPEKTHSIEVTIPQINFKNAITKDDKISLPNLTTINASFSIFKLKKQSKKSYKKNNFDLHIGNADLKNIKLQMYKPDGTKEVYSENLNVNAKNLIFNKDILEEIIPLKYDSINVSGKSLILNSFNETYTLYNFNYYPKNINIQFFSIKDHKKNTTNIDTSNIDIKINKIESKNKTLIVDIDQVFINSMNGVFTTKHPKLTPRHKTQANNISLNINKLILKKSNIFLKNDTHPIKFKNLSASLKNINTKFNSEKTIINVGQYFVTANSTDYITRFYSIKTGLINFSNNKIRIHEFSMIPRLSRNQFIKTIPAEKDLYTLKAAQIDMFGNWEFFSKNKFFNARNILINGISADIFRSKTPKDDTSVKPLYSELLRKINLPLFIENMVVKNSVLVYEEDTPKSNGPGKLTFSKFNMIVKNLNSGKYKNKPSKTPINIKCKFMNVSPMNVNWTFDTADLADHFSISGNIFNLPASEINPFIEPYLKIKASGSVNNLFFDFHGNKKEIEGKMNMKHQNLKITILKEGGKKDKILSALVNLFVKSNSKKFPENVLIEPVKRDPTKSFFNLFWKGIEMGLKKTLIGKNMNKTENTVKQTIENTKVILKKNRTEKNSIKKAESK